MKKENIYNIPNLLTILRVIITFIAVYFIFSGFNIIYVIVAFVIGALTDFFDGQIARRYHQKTEFGRKADMIADRFLMVGIALAFIIKLSIDGDISKYIFLQIFLIMSREIISLPFSIVLFMSGKDLPHARYIGKFTTTLQGFTFPCIILSIYYSLFSFSIYLAVLTAIVGFISGLYFIHDVFACENCDKETVKNERARRK